MPRISADYFFTPLGLKSDLILDFQDDGLITDLYPASDSAPKDVKHYEGIVAPGFVNAHCHLELSHLKGVIPEKTGMTGFIQSLVSIRSNYSDEDIKSAINKAIINQWNNGIQAIGDISNSGNTIEPKKAFPAMAYHNFIELFSLDPGKAEAVFQQGLDLQEQFEGLRSSITLHAPYSLSLNLRDRVQEFAHFQDKIQSIHFLESQEERQLFDELDGPLMGFIRNIGVGFQAHTYSSPVDLIFEKEKNGPAPLLLVHNTEIREEELQRITENHPQVFFVLCPHANLYIHDRLPPAELFAQFPDRICLGTDSLASNHDLDILEEMKCLQKAFPSISSETLLTWATQNGAKALGMDADLGSLQAGSRPGLVHIKNIDGSGRLTTKSKAQRIV